MSVVEGVLMNTCDASGTTKIASHRNLVSKPEAYVKHFVNIKPIKEKNYDI